MISRHIRLRNLTVPLKPNTILSRLLFLLPGHLQRLFLLPRNTGELAFRADEVAPWVEDGEEEQRNHHGKAVEGVGVLLVEEDWVFGSEAARKFDDAEDDSNLFVEITVLDTEQRGIELRVVDVP